MFIHCLSQTALLYRTFQLNTLISVFTIINVYCLRHSQVACHSWALIASSPEFASPVGRTGARLRGDDRLVHALLN